MAYQMKGWSPFTKKEDGGNYVTYNEPLYNSDGTKSNISQEHTTEIQSDADGNRYVHDEDDKKDVKTRYYLEKPDNSNIIT